MYTSKTTTIYNMRRICQISQSRDYYSDLNLWKNYIDLQNFCRINQVFLIVTCLILLFNNGICFTFYENNRFKQQIKRYIIKQFPYYISTLRQINQMY